MQAMTAKTRTMPRSLVFLCGFGVAAFYLWVLNAWNVATLASGLMSFFFMLYVFVSAIASERAQRLEDSDAIKDVQRLVRRCELAVKVVEDLMGGHPHDERVLVALRHLGTSMARFTSAYRRYLKDEAAADAGEAEHAILIAQVAGASAVEGCAVQMSARIARIKAGIRDVDDPRLVAARRRL